MITVYSQVKDYCQKNFKEDPKPEDLSAIGKLVSSHFRMDSKFTRGPGEGPIPDTGLVKETQPHGRFVSTGYPDAYWEEMIPIIGEYYILKASKRK